MPNSEPFIQKYEQRLSNGNIGLTQLDGAQMRDEMADNLKTLLDAKMKALRASVEWAEEQAKNYQWDEE